MLPKNHGLRSLLLSGIFLIASNLASAVNADLAAVGPIDQVNCSAGTFRVLGIRYQASKKSVMSSLCATSAKAELAYVVIGSRNSSGKAIALSVAEVGSEMYVPGASTVFVRGPVSRVNPLSGDFEVVGTRVTGLVGKLPALNESVDVVGTQPLPGDVVLASVVAPTPSSKAAADTTLTNVIVGSGASSNVIVGSGSSSNVIVGSGASTSVIVGSGNSSNVIVGSGASANVIVGSGASKSVIVGSGKSSNVIVGSGASTNVIVGSGLQ